MNCTSKSGFILPLAFIISAAILLSATLLLRQSEFEFEQSGVASVHFCARDALRKQVPLIVDYLEQRLSEDNSTTFLQKTADPDSLMYRAHLFTGSGNNRIPMGSFLRDAPGGRVVFRSPVSGISLLCDKINVAPPDEPPLHMAWSLEDIQLAADSTTSVSWWPLQGWHWSPGLQSSSLAQVFNQLSGMSIDDIEWIPEQQPLEFRPEMSPAFTPVVYHVGLRFGIFASGSAGQREKVVRMRYYIDCGLWNPYNRELQFHGRNRPDPVFQVVMWNLPRLRITNITQGVSTGWIGMDDLVNPQTGAMGIHGWVRMNQGLAPAESVLIHEPDTKSQPEGLARLVHPSFMLGPADEVHVEFQPSERGISIACLGMDESTPLVAAQNGDGWFRVEDFTIDLPDMEFDRADAPQHPFYLEYGSLSFREQHVQMEISADRTDALVRLESDPRRKTIRSTDDFVAASGVYARDADQIRLQVHNRLE